MKYLANWFYQHSLWSSGIILLTGIILLAIILILLPLVSLLCIIVIWHILIVPVFGLPELTIAQAAAVWVLLILCRIYIK